MTSPSRILIEVFLDPSCSSTDAVTAAVRALPDLLSAPVRVRFFHRGTDAVEFIRRGVVICPALYINGRLAFYGAMTTREILTYIRTHHPHYTYTGESL